MKLRYEVRDMAGQVVARCFSEGTARETAAMFDGRSIWFIENPADVRPTKHARNLEAPDA